MAGGVERGGRKEVCGVDRRVSQISVPPPTKPIPTRPANPNSRPRLDTPARPEGEGLIVVGGVTETMVGGVIDAGVVDGSLLGSVSVAAKDAARSGGREASAALDEFDGVNSSTEMPPWGSTGVMLSDTGIWQACSKAVAKACIEAKRCLGSLARAMKTTVSTASDSPATCSRSEGGGSELCLKATSVSEPSKGRLPLNHS